MTIVKPPSFSELVKTYGSPMAAVHHLLESGYSPEEIAWRMSVPYYLVHLYMKGVKTSKPPFFSDIVQVYERLALLRSKKGKETELAKFFQRKDLDPEVKNAVGFGEKC
ncbi:MAG: hypothetical protein ACLFU9_00060 [Candidatus Bathyarchaeia archaeon]